MVVHRQRSGARVRHVTVAMDGGGGQASKQGYREEVKHLAGSDNAQSKEGISVGRGLDWG